MKTIVVGVQDSPDARAAVRIAAAVAQGLGGRMVVCRPPKRTKTATPTKQGETR